MEYMLVLDINYDCVLYMDAPENATYKNSL